jgi:phytoene dehydrogenase-like protein
MSAYNVIVVGGGHNGIVCATFLARSGLKVVVLEDRDVIGGACRTEKPFGKVPDLVASTGAYLIGLMPPELMAMLGVNIPLIKRKPHYFLPTRESGYLLLGAGDDTRKQFHQFFSEQDWQADQALQAELEAIRSDLHRCFLEEPLSVEETAEQYIRPELRQVFINLCRGSVGSYLDRFPFRSELLKAMYASTDGFTGCYGTWDTPGTGFNFLLHNMCRLPGADGTWMTVDGGMGTVTRLLAEAAQSAGVEFRTSCKVASIAQTAGKVDGVALADGSELKAPVVVCNCDPYRMRDLFGSAHLSAAFNQRLDRYAKLTGTSYKLNIVLDRLPTFRCLPEDRGQFNTTIHLLPEGPGIIEKLKEIHRAAESGRLPDNPLVEWYFNPSLKDDAGRSSSALFVQSAPYEPEGGWAQSESKFINRLLSTLDEFAPGTSNLVVDMLPLSPKAIEERFGIRGGHIFHVDHRFPLNERLPYAIPGVAGLYACGAACHPGGGVTGAPGYISSQKVLKDLAIVKS